MMLTQAVAAVVSATSADMLNGEAGTSTTLFVKSQAGVLTAIGSTDIVLVDNTIIDVAINVVYFLTTSLANGSDITEYEVNDGNSIAYNRVVRTALGKKSTDELTMIHTFKFGVV